MEVRIFGSESMGVRSLSCEVVTARRHLLIDAGVALAPRRQGRPPHIYEMAAALGVRRRINKASGAATEVVISHYHNDHITPAERRLYHWSSPSLAEEIYGPERPIYAKSWRDNINKRQRNRARSMQKRWGEFIEADGKRVDDELSFSPALYHGEQGSMQGHVIATCVRDGGECFVHAGDIQGMDDEAVDWVVTQRPDLVFMAGPPLYLQILSEQAVKACVVRLARLRENCGTLVLDHHVCRGKDWESFREWIVNLAQGKEVLTAAEYMKVEPMMLESMRYELYKERSVPRGFHPHAAQGDAESLAVLEEALAFLDAGKRPMCLETVQGEAPLTLPRV